MLGDDFFQLPDNGITVIPMRLDNLPIRSGKEDDFDVALVLEESRPCLLVNEGGETEQGLLGIGGIPFCRRGVHGYRQGWQKGVGFSSSPIPDILPP